MKENKLLSVIIPVYNVEKYLNKCIESIVNQKYENLEIILVDDGSTDNSGKICDQWAKNDERIKVYHKENGGLSDARNYGIERSNGIYLGFVDADDYIDKNMYLNLINGCEKYKKDIGCCNKIRVYKNNFKYENKIKKNKTVKNNEALLLLLLLSDPSSCNKIYKKELFKKIKFPKGKLYEDIATIPYIIDISNGMYLDKINGYYYIQRKNSIIHNKFNLNKMDYMINTKMLKEYITYKYSNTDLEEAAKCFYILSLTALLTNIYSDRKKYKKEYEKIINEMKQIDYISNKYIKKYKKIMIWCDLHHMIWLVNLIKIILKK